MGVPQVSVQALLNEAERHKTWESLETCLMGLLEKGQVLDYKHEGTHVMVVLNGVTQPVRIPVRNPEAPPKAEVSADSFEESQPAETKGGGTAVATPPKTAAKKAVKAAALKAPMGVVALIGLKTESYEHHARRLAKHIIKTVAPKLVNVDQAADLVLQDWFRGLK